MRRRALLDAAIALAFFVIAEVSAISGALDGPRAVTVATAALMTLPLAVRRSRPVAAAVAVGLGLGLQSIFGESPTAIWVIPLVMLAAYSPGANLPLRPAFAAGAGLLAGAWTLSLLDSTNGAADKVFTAPIFTVLPWLGGRVVRRLAEQRREFAELTLALEHEREERARTAVELERARIARDLHDVVAHAVSVIVVQAEAGDALLDREPSRAHDAFAAIESTGRAALAEMRRLVGLLRDADASREPRPGLHALPALAAQLEESGLQVRLEVIDQGLEALPTGLELAAYRIVQEALTNTMRHADARRVDIAVRRTDRELEVTVADDGRGAGTRSGNGFGLVGMRERVALFGGVLEAGSETEGGFRVRARLPL